MADLPDFGKAVLKLVEDGMPYHSSSPIGTSICAFIIEGTLKGRPIPNCSHCGQQWNAFCPHFVYTFTGPVYLER